ncbi:MAG: hypothetical protein WAU02_00960 [Candidatus Saccharimonadales bacterium]
MRRTYHTNASGFTIVELVLASSISIVVVSVFVSLLFTTYQSSTRNKVVLDMTGRLQTSLSFIERDVRYSVAYLTGISSPFSDSNAPAGGWTHKGSPASSTNRALILKSYATANNPFSPTRQAVYVNGSVSNPYIPADALLNCSTTPPAGSLYLNPQLPYMTIYFVSSGKLTRRIITDTTTSLCNGAVTYQKQSCPTGTGGSCLAKDEIITEDVAGLSIDYYQQLDTPTPSFALLDPYKATNPDDLATADNINATVTLNKTVGGKTINRSMSITVSRINN